MSEPALGACSLCGMRLSPVRLEALLRRRALERLIATSAGAKMTQRQLARVLSEAGHPTSRVIVAQDLALIGTVRAAEVRYQLSRLIPNP